MNTSEMRKHFIESLYEVLDGVVSPTPYLEITEKDVLGINFLEGKGQLPSPDATEISILDAVVASLFFDDFNLLFEGGTGYGKTYTSDAVFNTVFGSDGFYTLRLSGGVLGGSVLDPFTETRTEGGVPKTHINQDKCERYGGFFIDEINRGEPDELYQVVDGKIHINGDKGRLGIPIPGTNRLKGLAIIGAMNPADAEYSGASELDIAGENRFLKIRYPNSAIEAASSQPSKKDAESLHELFWNTYKEKTQQTGGWKEIYPVLADGESMQTEFSEKINEFIDVALGYIGDDPLKTYARNEDLIKQGGLKPKFSIIENNDIIRIAEIQNNLRYGITRRDKGTINNASRLVSFVKSVKNGTYEPSVSLNDVATGMGIVLESKMHRGADAGDIMILVSDVETAYRKTLEDKDMPIPTGYGLRQTVLEAAVNSGVEYGYEGYIQTIDQNIERLNKDTNSVAEATIRSRLLADLVVLKHFSNSYAEEISGALNEQNDAFIAFNKIYDEHRSESSVYEHRLKSFIK